MYTVCLPIFLSWLCLTIFYFFFSFSTSIFLCVFVTIATAATRVAVVAATAATTTVPNGSTIQNLARTRTQQQYKSKSQLNKHKFKVIWRHLDGNDGGDGSSSGFDVDAIHLLFSYCFSSNVLTISVCSNSFLWFWMLCSPTARCQMYRYEIYLLLTHKLHRFHSLRCLSILVSPRFRIVSISLVLYCFRFRFIIFLLVFLRFFVILRFALVGTVGDFVLLI